MTLQKNLPAATGKLSKNHNHSVPAGMANVKNPLRRLRLMKGIPASDLIRTVRTAYPRYDKSLQSKCERTEEYGVALCDEAMDILIQTYAPEMDRKAAKTERRAKPCRVTCRLTEADYALLQQLITANGYGTMQEYIHQLLIRQIRRWDREQRHAALHAG